MRDFTGFRFGQVHSEDLHLVVVSSSNRYVKPVLPALKDYTTEVPGGNGSYYFGETFTTQEFSVSVAFDSVDEKTWRRISQLFGNDKPQDLVFDELPYKTYRAKLKSKPDFKFVCFTKNGERVYKGEGTLNFICYFPFAFGFNKYVVRAADYYKCNMPKDIINQTIKDNPYKKAPRPKMLPGLIKDHYNVIPNMSTPWKGGYPSIEQVQWGELYFNNPKTGEKEIIDTRAYFDNIPEWQGAAQLLVSPTLDFDRELIYMPQYSQNNYYNMDMGLNRQNGIIGSRILVYNPGDLPVDFEIRLGNLVSQYRTNMKDGGVYKFRVSRYNVERLTIPQAVDWCGMRPYKQGDEKKFKYGKKYFTILERSSNITSDWKKIIENNENWDYDIKERNLGKAHPHHAYYVEPIPREKLGDFIRLFYWQSIQQDKNETMANMNDSLVMTWEQGKEYANRYEELYDLCITDEERYELYWETLKEVILKPYQGIYENRYSVLQRSDADFFKNKNYTIDDFIWDYINCPPEYIHKEEDLDYGEFLFNVYNYPSYYTYDYLEIDSTDFDKIIGGECGCDIDAKSNYKTIQPLFIDFSKRMMYNVNDPEWDSDTVWQKNNPDKLKNYYHYKPSKKIFNENIRQGKWFKIPPGWSLIEVAPVIDMNISTGKRWLEARPFKWGSTDAVLRKHFDNVYKEAAIDYLTENCPVNSDIYTTEWTPGIQAKNTDTYEEKATFFKSLTLAQLEPYLEFRRWYEVTSDTLSAFEKKLYQRRLENTERGFLKLLDSYWRVNTPDINGQPSGTIDDWWWYANHYIWANFPPVYWAYADLLNTAYVKYTPLFY